MHKNKIPEEIIAHKHKNNTFIFGQNSSEKPNLGKPVQEMRVLLLYNNEESEYSLDA